MNSKRDFKAVTFNENQPHKATEWWSYWLNRYNSTATENTDMRDYMRDKFKRGLVSDAN